MKYLICASFFLILFAGCASSLETKYAIETGQIRLGITKQEVVDILGNGKLNRTQYLESGDILEVWVYKDWKWAYNVVVDYWYWIAFVNDRVLGFGSAGEDKTTFRSSGQGGMSFLCKNAIQTNNQSGIFVHC